MTKEEVIIKMIENAKSKEELETLIDLLDAYQYREQEKQVRAKEAKKECGRCKKK